MDRKEFKRELERHKNHLTTSYKFLQQGFEDLNKRNYEFYEFIEANYYDLEERLIALERKVKDLSCARFQVFDILEQPFHTILIDIGRYPEQNFVRSFFRQS